MFISVINASIAASWLILAVIVLRLLLRKAPRWITCLLWGMAGLRLVCPFSLKSVFSLVPSGETLPSTIEYDAVPQINSGVSSLNSAVNPILSEHFAATPQYSANPMQMLLGIAEYLWLIGMGIMLLYLAVSYIVLRIKLRTATRLRDNIMESERVSSPFVLGIVNPHIYLPYGISSGDSAHVIAHEQAHIARGDHIVKPLAFLVLTVHWFNPFVWIGYILLCRDIETACDQRAIKSLDDDGRRDYSRALVRCSTRPTAAACPLAFGEVSVKARVKSVLSYKKPALWIIIGAIAVCAVTAVCFLTNPLEQKELFGRQYAEVELTYQSPQLSSIAYPERKYILTPDHRLALLEGSGQINIGRLSAIELTRDNFDNYFFNADGLGWISGESAVSIRRNCQSAWMLIGEDDILYYVIQQNNGDVYMATGWHDSEGVTDPYSDDSSITRVFRLDEVLDPAATDLDREIDSAAINYHSGKYLPGEFVCASHTLLATESESIGGGVERITAYAIVRYSEFSLVDGLPEDISGSDIPSAITFDVTEDGQYTLVEYWLPGDGTYYASDLKAKYPDGVSWNTSIGHEQRTADCYAQACAWFGINAPDKTEYEPLDVLDAAIAAAALKANGSGVGGDFRCSSHVLIGIDFTEDGERMNSLTAYTLLKYSEYRLNGGMPEEVSSVSGPTVIIFDVSPEGEYTCLEYHKPLSGSEHIDELYEKFPDGVVWDSVKAAEFNEASCFAQACERYGISVTTSDTGVAYTPQYTTVAVSALTDRVYVNKSEVELLGQSALTLYADGRGMLTFGDVSSYIAFGVWSMDGDCVVLTAPGMDEYIDGKWVSSQTQYVFRMDGDRMIFLADRSGKVPEFGTGIDKPTAAPFRNGSVFLLTEDQ